MRILRSKLFQAVPLHIRPAAIPTPVTYYNPDPIRNLCIGGKGVDMGRIGIVIVVLFFSACQVVPYRQFEESETSRLLIQDPAALDQILDAYVENGCYPFLYARLEDRDGSVLYEHKNDELEWTNLAGKEKYDRIKSDLAQWLPKTNSPPVPRPKPKSRREK